MHIEGSEQANGGGWGVGGECSGERTEEQLWWFEGRQCSAHPGPWAPFLSHSSSFSRLEPCPARPAVPGYLEHVVLQLLGLL